MPKDEIGASQVVYYWEDGILMRKWAPSADDSGCNTVYQIVVPAGYRAQILSLAHDNVLSGHLGVAKTYYRILRHFFWPGLKRCFKTLPLMSYMSGGWETKPSDSTGSTSSHPCDGGAI